MKIILRADVENLGHLGDVVSVKPGYGRNYLLPQGLAMLATPANLKVFELERKKLQARMDALRAEANEHASRLEGLVLVIAMRVGKTTSCMAPSPPASSEMLWPNRAWISIAVAFCSMPPSVLWASIPCAPACMRMLCLPSS